MKSENLSNHLIIKFKKRFNLHAHGYFQHCIRSRRDIINIVWEAAADLSTMCYRSRQDIINIVLKAANYGNLKTHIDIHKGQCENIIS